MVRPPDQRKRMYEAKVDPEILATQTRVLKALMVREETRYFPVITMIEEKVKKLVEAEGIPTIQVRDYLNFGREMYELTKRFSGSTLSGEAQLRVNKWSSRGLTGTLLVRIAQLFGVSPSAPPTLKFLPLIHKTPVGNYIVSYYAISRFGFTDLMYSGSVTVHPFPLTRRMVFDQIAKDIVEGGGAGSEIRLGVYDSNDNGLPNNLLFETPPISIETLGLKTYPCNLDLEAGLYFLGWQCNVDKGRNRRTDTIGLCHFQAFPPPETTYALYRACGRQVPYGNFPDPFGTPEWFDDVIFWVALRLASVP